MKTIKISLNATLLILALILLTSCEDRIKDDTRVLITGNITDDFNNSIPQVEVFTAPEFDRMPSSDGYLRDYPTDYVLGNDLSNDNGEFEFNSLIIGNTLSISVRTGDFIAYNTTRSFSSLNQSQFTFDLGNVVLRKKSLVNFTFTNNTSTTEDLTYEIAYQIPSCFEELDNNSLNLANSNCFEIRTVSNTISATTINPERSVSTIQESTITVNYRIGAGPISTQTFSTSNPTHDYEIIY